MVDEELQLYLGDRNGGKLRILKIDRFSTVVEITNPALSNGFSTPADLSLLDVNGVIQIRGLEAFVDEQGLKMEDRRKDGGGLWVVSRKGVRLNSKTKYGHRLQSAGFQWSEIKGGWYVR